jgi:hypothetical protein
MISKDNGDDVGTGTSPETIVTQDVVENFRNARTILAVFSSHPFFILYLELTMTLGTKMTDWVVARLEYIFLFDRLRAI